MSFRKLLAERNLCRGTDVLVAASGHACDTRKRNSAGSSTGGRLHVHVSDQLLREGQCDKQLPS